MLGGHNVPDPSFAFGYGWKAQPHRKNTFLEQFAAGGKGRFGFAKQHGRNWRLAAHDVEAKAL